MTFPARSVRRELTARRTNLKLYSPSPTVTLSAADAATSITGATTRGPLTDSSGAQTTIDKDRYFQWLGTPSMSFQSAPNAAYVASPVLTGSAASARYAPSVIFDFYGDKLEFILKALATTRDYRLWVDGELVTENSNRLTVVAGSVYRLIVDFGSVAHRRIRFDFDGSSFGGVACAPLHDISRPPLVSGVPTVLVGDSLLAGANTGSGAAGYSRIDSWGQIAAALLGWDDVRNTAIAGTGYVNVGTDAALTSRLADFTAHGKGARFLISAGFNDVAATSDVLSAAVDVVFSAIVATSPLEVIVMGCHAPNANYYTQAAYVAVNEILRAKAAQYGFLFVDQFALKAITGTGNATTTNGTGNADIFTNGDNTHYTRAGAQRVGRVNAQAIANAYPLMQAALGS